MASKAFTHYFRDRSKDIVKKSLLPVAGIGDIAGSMIDAHSDPTYDQRKIIPVGSRGYEPYAAFTRGFGNWGGAFKKGGRVKQKAKKKTKRKRK